MTKAKRVHRNFIISTWLKSYEQQARRQGLKDVYATHEPSIAESRWEDCWVVSDDEGYTVYGWVCGERSPARLWHVYVVPELRKLRVATRLIEQACGNATELQYARPWPYGSHGRVNPYLLRTK